jgi:hypothetical protein
MVNVSATLLAAAIGLPLGALLALVRSPWPGARERVLDVVFRRSGYSGSASPPEGRHCDLTRLPAAIHYRSLTDLNLTRNIRRHSNRLAAKMLAMARLWLIR